PSNVCDISPTSHGRILAAEAALLRAECGDPGIRYG
ncbi:unnamed protein product, partial [Tuber aestivum]